MHISALQNVIANCPKGSTMGNPVKNQDINKIKIRDMSKIMTVDVLSSIKGAKPSEAVDKLFEVIKNANTTNQQSSNTRHNNALSLNDLRTDTVIDSSALEKQIIIENFPKSKNGYLVVSKVIEE